MNILNLKLPVTVFLYTLIYLSVCLSLMNDLHDELKTVHGE